MIKGKFTFNETQYTEKQAKLKDINQIQSIIVIKCARLSEMIIC